jgi:uncharacterized protein
VDHRAHFLDLVQRNPINVSILDRGPTLGVPGVRFSSSKDAIDHFASTTCCFGVSRLMNGELVDYAPHGYADLFAKRVRPNPRLAPREVYETKARRWQQEWPSLVVGPWPAPA